MVVCFIVDGGSVKDKGSEVMLFSVLQKLQLSLGNVRFFWGEGLKFFGFCKEERSMLFFFVDSGRMSTLLLDVFCCYCQFPIQELPSSVTKNKQYLFCVSKLRRITW